MRFSTIGLFLMGRRLQELYQPGDRVEILFAAADGAWQPAIVLRHQPPGMWVAAADGRAWFVTNTRRVRRPTAPLVFPPPSG